MRGRWTLRSWTRGTPTRLLIQFIIGVQEAAIHIKNSQSELLKKGEITYLCCLSNVHSPPFSYPYFAPRPLIWNWTIPDPHNTSHRVIRTPASEPSAPTTRTQVLVPPFRVSEAHGHQADRPPLRLDCGCRGH